MYRENDSFISDYTVIDLEMTGLSAKHDKVIEMGAVRVRNGAVAQTFSCFVNPNCPIPERVTELTGITDEMIQSEGLGEDEAMEALLAFLGEDILVGQNVTFDFSFLKQWAVNHRRPLEALSCDTLKIARKLLPPEQPKRLDALCDFFGIRRENAHRALDDAIETQQLFECLKKEAVRLSVVDEQIFLPKPLQYKAKRQTPVTPHQIRQLKEYRKLHGIEEEIHWETLTRNEASRIMDIYYATYGR